MKTMLLVTILLGLLLVWACSSPSSKPSQQTETMPYILLKTGETVPIQLETPTEPGYNWYYNVSSDWVISMIEPYEYPAKSGGEAAAPVSAADKKVFQVTGLKPGTVTIGFYQMNPAMGNTRNGAEVVYTVEVKTF